MSIEAYPAKAFDNFIVVTSTTRPSLPWSGLQIFETDTKRTYIWDGGQWALLSDGLTIVTSVTRPAVPINGQFIYETDTDRMLHWDGAAWVLPRNVAAGYVAGDLTNLNGTAAMALSKGAAEAVVGGASTAIATSANRRYKITAMVSTTAGGSWTWAGLRIRRGNGTGGTQVGLAYYTRTQMSSSQAAMWVIGWDVPGAQASQQWCLTHQLDTSVCDLYGPEWIAVEDVGAA